MKEAFVYMFKDENFWQKAAMYYMVILVANVMISYSALMSSGQNAFNPIVTLFINFILLISIGYGFSCIKYLMQKNDDVVLPSVNLVSNFISGLKYVLSVLLIMIVLALLFGLIAMTKIPAVIIVFAALAGISYFVFYVAFMCLFAHKGMITTYFRFPSVSNIVNDNIGKYIISFILYIVLSIVIGSINLGIMALIGVLIPNNIAASILTGLLISVFATYFVYVSSYIVAGAVNIKNID